MAWSASYLIVVTVMAALGNVTAQTLVTCFSCLKSRTSWNSKNTCPESFQPPGATTCQGRACLMILSEYEGDGSALSVKCYTNELDNLLGRFHGQWSLSVSTCTSLGTEFYVFDGMCCTAQQKQQLSPTTAYKETICFCDSNHCNRNLASFHLKSAPTRAVLGKPTGKPTAAPIPGGLGTGAIVGIVITLGVVVIIIAVVCWKRKDVVKFCRSHCPCKKNKNNNGSPKPKENIRLTNSEKI